MIPMGAALEQLISAAILGNTPASSKSNARADFTALAAFFALVGVIFILAGSYDWLRDHFGGQRANIYMGGIVITLALVCALIASGIAYGRMLIARRYRKEVVKHIRETVDAITAEIEEPILENPKTAAALAALSGYVAGQRLL